MNCLRIQRFKRLIHWFHFDPVRDLLHLLTVKTFLLHLATEFLCERMSSIFWRLQKSCSILHRQIRLRTPTERVVFSDCQRIWHPQSLSQQQTKYSAAPPTQHIFLPPISGWSRDQLQPGSFFQRRREAEKRDPGNEVAFTFAARSCLLRQKRQFSVYLQFCVDFLRIYEIEVNPLAI